MLYTESPFGVTMKSLLGVVCVKELFDWGIRNTVLVDHVPNFQGQTQHPIVVVLAGRRCGQGRGLQEGREDRRGGSDCPLGANVAAPEVG